MKKISFYQTVNDLLEKTVCLITEKCYLNNFRVVIVTADEEMRELINKQLWTYSQKQFIPHGSKLDPMPSIQPVYITDELENINNANTLILVNKLIPDFLTSTSSVDLSQFDRIFIVYNSKNEELCIDINNFINKLNKSNIKTDCFKQTQKGKWEYTQRISRSGYSSK